MGGGGGGGAPKLSSKIGWADFFGFNILCFDISEKKLVYEVFCAYFWCHF